MVDKIISPPTAQAQINKINEIIDNLGQGGSGGLSYTATCPAITISSGVASWSVTHNLGTTSVIAMLYNSSGSKQECNVVVNSTNTIIVSFKASSNISAGAYTIIVFASGADADTSNLADKSLSNINDTAKILIANAGMPSSSPKSYTVGASGTSYIAPADGYFAANAWGNSNFCWMDLVGDGWMQAGACGNDAGFNYKAYLPIRKGASMSLNYGGMRDVTLYFNYAVGAVSEAS